MEKQEIEITEFQQEGYKSLVDFDTWRVAVLKYCDDVRIEHIHTMQKHNETDEVFVLLQGSCTLLLGESHETPREVSAVAMERHKVYNVKKGIWHNHVLSIDGEVLIIENQNTSDDNSPIENLTEEQVKEIQTLVYRYYFG